MVISLIMASMLIQCPSLLLLVLAGASYADAMALDYDWSVQAGGWLAYHHKPATWDQARLRCQADGAVLASPHTEEQKAAIISLVQYQGSDDDQEIFTGVHAIFSKGDYSSIEGVPLLRLAVTWALGQPDNYADEEQCLSMRVGHNGTMADTRCDRELPYVCFQKVSNSVVTEKDTDYEFEWNEQTKNWTKYPLTAGTRYETDESKVKEYRFDYQWNEQAAGWFKYHVVPATYDMAKKRCKAEGAVLASPQDDTLMSALAAFLRTKKVTDSLSIFTRDEQTGDYEDFEYCTMTVNNETLSFTTICEGVLPYVCYKENTELTMTECGTTDPEYVFETKTGSCYKFQNRGLIWSEAYMTCAAEGGYLAIINNDVEAEVIRQILAKQPLESFYTFYGFYLTAVGLYDWSNLGHNFSTIHGEPLEANYHTWHAGEPNNYPNTLTDDPGEYCGTVGPDRELYDYACHVPTAFICEKSPSSLLKTEYTFNLSSSSDLTSVESFMTLPD